MQLHDAFSCFDETPFQVFELLQIQTTNHTTAFGCCRRLVLPWELQYIHTGDTLCKACIFSGKILECEQRAVEKQKQQEQKQRNASAMIHRQGRKREPLTQDPERTIKRSKPEVVVIDD